VQWDEADMKTPLSEQTINDQFGLMPDGLAADTAQPGCNCVRQFPINNEPGKNTHEVRIPIHAEVLLRLGYL